MEKHQIDRSALDSSQDHYTWYPRRSLSHLSIEATTFVRAYTTLSAWFRFQTRCTPSRAVWPPSRLLIRPPNGEHPQDEDQR
jgi:hypothetical protein